MLQLYSYKVYYTENGKKSDLYRNDKNKAM